MMSILKRVMIEIDIIISEMFLSVRIRMFI